MMLYLKQRAIPIHEYSQKILAKLMSKAGDVVKIKLYNNKSINHTANPHVIFYIFKQHFSKMTYSSMLLADFFNTVPMLGEDAVEHQIRLNKAVDVVTECLKRHGCGIDDLGHEVSMMFIKHCPDESLKFKSAEKSTAYEIQEWLDEHMQEKKTQATASKSLKPCTAVHKAHSQYHVPTVDDAPVLTTAVLLTVPSSVPSDAGGVDNNCMKSLVFLLDHLLTQQTQVQANFGPQATLPNTSQKVLQGLQGSRSFHIVLLQARKQVS